MSMISAQIDELRELAGDGSMEWVTGPIRASVLRDAADTIWQLRDDLQRANTENAKLREERDYHKALWEHVTVTDCELRRVRAAWKEDREKNDKLRELVKMMLLVCKSKGIVGGVFAQPDSNRNLPNEHVNFESCARELGVEV